MKEEKIKLRKELDILKEKIGKVSTSTRKTEAGIQTPDCNLDSLSRKEGKRKGKDKEKGTFFFLSEEEFTASNTARQKG